MLQLVVTGGPVLVGWAVVPSGVTVVLGDLSVLPHVHGEVTASENTVVRNGVVLGRGLEVVQMLEVGRVGVTQDQGHVRVAIVDRVGLLTGGKAQKVVFEDRVLVVASSLRARSLPVTGVTHGKDVLVNVVLKGVLVHVKHSACIGEAAL